MEHTAQTFCVAGGLAHQFGKHGLQRCTQHQTGTHRTVADFKIIAFLAGSHNAGADSLFTDTAVDMSGNLAQSINLHLLFLEKTHRQQIPVDFFQKLRCILHKRNSFPDIP